MPLVQSDETLKKYIGSGLIFPIQLENGKAKTYSGAALIRSSIYIILAWQVGIKFFNSDFGSKTETQLGEPNDDILKSSLTYYVKDAISKWEKRVDIVDSKTFVETVYPDKVLMKLTYRIKNSPIEDSFTYPFYRIIAY